MRAYHTIPQSAGDSYVRVGNPPDVPDDATSACLYRGQLAASSAFSPLGRDAHTIWPVTESIPTADHTVDIQACEHDGRKSYIFAFIQTCQATSSFGQHGRSRVGPAS